MGTQYFESKATGRTAEEAYKNCKANSEWSPDGYTGNINVKPGFEMVTLLEGEELEVGLERLNDTDLVQSKWGPAACLELGNDQWLFFGWASS